MMINLKKKSFLLGIVFAAIIFVLAWFTFIFLFNRIKASSEDFSFRKKELISFEKKNEDFEKFKKSYQVYQENLGKFEKDIEALLTISELGVPTEFINFIEELAEDCNISVAISEYSQGVGVYPWPALNFQLSLSGSYSNFLKFLEKIESTPDFLIEVFDLNVSKSRAGTFTASISLRVFNNIVGSPSF